MRKEGALSKNSRSFKERFLDHSMRRMDKEAKEKEAFKKCTLEEGGYSTRKGRGNVQGLPYVEAD